MRRAARTNDGERRSAQKWNDKAEESRKRKRKKRGVFLDSVRMQKVALSIVGAHAIEVILIAFLDRNELHEIDRRVRRDRSIGSGLPIWELRAEKYEEK